MNGWIDHPFKRVHYRSEFTDTDRWEQLPHRSDDIFVITPAKNGTTWMQTIVTFLVFGSSDLDFVPADRSPWFDRVAEPMDDVLRRLGADEKRNIIKTHTPLDGVPFYEDAIYIGVYRDPRDAFFSMRNHADNMHYDIGISGVSLEKQWRAWLTKEFTPGDRERCLGYPVHHLKCLWALKDRSNVHIFHYADLQRDLKGEIARVAGAIGAETSEAQLAEFAEAATFANMKAKAEKFVPDVERGYWKEPAEFLKKGESGQFREVVSQEMLDQFDKRLHDLAGPKIAHFLLNGFNG